MQPQLPALKDHNIAAIVLAAGRGTRMGDAPKLLLPLKSGKTILRHAVENVVALQPLSTIAVVRPDLPEVEISLRDLPVRCVANPRYVEGMGTSLAAGIMALEPDVQAALVVLGDEPFVSARIFERLLEAYLRERKAVTIPRYGEQFGPPTIFSREIFPSLETQEGDAGGRHIVAGQADRVCIVQFKAEERPADVDTPDDYRVLL